jgi:hypothetical protein
MTPVTGSTCCEETLLFFIKKGFIDQNFKLITFHHILMEALPNWYITFINAKVMKLC